MATLEKIVEHRLTICQNCDKMTDKHTCSETKDLLLNMVIIRSNKCPLNKWYKPFNGTLPLTILGDNSGT